MELGLVIATSILALITCWYAFETRRMVRRMDREVEEIHRPILAFQLIPWEANLLKLRIQNVGNGAANKIEGKLISVTKEGTTIVPWSYSVLNCDKYEEFGIPMPAGKDHLDMFDIERIKETVIEVKAEFIYNSIAGKQYELKDSIQIQHITSDWVASKMMATQDNPERIMPRIAKSLEELAKKEKRPLM
jgi:hypothetical protein